MVCCLSLGACCRSIPLCCLSIPLCCLSIPRCCQSIPPTGYHSSSNSATSLHLKVKLRISEWGGLKVDLSIFEQVHIIAWFIFVTGELMFFWIDLYRCFHVVIAVVQTQRRHASERKPSQRNTPYTILYMRSRDIIQYNRRQERHVLHRHGEICWHSTERPLRRPSSTAIGWYVSM